MIALRFPTYGFQDEAVLERHGYPRLPGKKLFALISSVDKAYLSCGWIVQETALSTKPLL